MSFYASWSSLYIDKFWVMSLTPSLSCFSLSLQSVSFLSSFWGCKHIRSSFLQGVSYLVLLYIKITHKGGKRNDTEELMMKSSVSSYISSTFIFSPWWQPLPTVIILDLVVTLIRAGDIIKNKQIRNHLLVNYSHFLLYLSSTWSSAWPLSKDVLNISEKI